MILLDEGLLTELRTAAAGAVSARLLSPDLDGDEMACIGMLGTGIQARYQLRYLAHVTTCRRVRVWGRTEAHVKKFIADLKAEGWDVASVDSPQKLLSTTEHDFYCPLIITTTSAREPLLKLVESKKRAQPLHITCIGSDVTGKMEIDPALVATADLLVTDSRLQARERGEYEEALVKGLVSLDNVLELGELVQRKDLHRRKEGGNGEEDCRFTIFDSSGVAVQDCVIATMFLQKELQDRK
jgi:ornithine cyclodeaminase